MKNIFKTLKKILNPISISEFARSGRAVSVAKTMISYYYYVLPFMAYLFLTNGVEAKPNYEPIFPLLWTKLTTLESPEIAIIVKLFFVLVSLVAALLHKYQSVRLLAFLAIFQVHGIESSFGHINHQWYMWLYTSLIFVFLPNIWDQKVAPFAKRRLFLFHVWFAQASVMLIYTMAGVWKFKAAYQQFLDGEIHNFSLGAFAYQVADWTLLLQEEAFLAPIIINNQEWFWIPYAVLPFIQVFSIWVMIRTSLQKVWVLVLLFFHMAVFLTMGIGFTPQILLVILLFFNSPFVPPGVTAKKIFFDLPIIGQIAELIARKRRQTSVYT